MAASLDGVVSRDMAEQPSSLTNGYHVKPPVSREEALADVKDMEARGAVIHNFDPEASPEQKRAQALSDVKERLEPLTGRLHDRRHGGTEVVTDIGGHNVKPTITLADVSAASKAEQQRAPDTQAASQAAIPGGLPSEIAAAIPEWYRVGWRAQSQAVMDTGGDIVEARHIGLLEEFVSESYYGAWYHNAAIIFFAVWSSHFVTVFGGGKGWLLIILAVCSTYYRTSVERVRYRARDDINRQLSKQRMFDDKESVEWMNNFLSSFWLIYEPVLSATIVASVDYTLALSAPPGVESMRLTHFTLGTKAPRIDFIRTHAGAPTNVIVMDWKISFTPNDTADMTIREAADKVNPKIALTLRVGKGKVSAAKDIIVEDVSFAGTMRLTLKLMQRFPHVQTMDLSFIERPQIDYAAKPLGFDLNMIPGLANFINNQVHATLGPMMYDPNVFTINLEQLLSLAPIDTAIGVIQLTIHNARGLKGVKFAGGMPDPYIRVSVGSKLDVAKTTVKSNTPNPHWNETFFILINSFNDPLVLNILDFNEVRKDGELGSAAFDCKTLEADVEQDNLHVPVVLNAKDRGELEYSVRYFPVVKPGKSSDGSDEPLPESNTGIVRLTLHQAKDLKVGKGIAECNAFAEIYLKGKVICTTPTFKRNHNPMWETHTEFLVTAKRDAVIGVQVIHKADFATDPVIGKLNINLVDILTATERGQDWFPLGSTNGKVRMSATFKPVIMAGAVNSARDFRKPIGIARILFESASDLKNVEKLTAGKSDPYVRVLRNGLVVARTLVFNNNLDPKFDEILYVPVHSTNETLVFECMDYQENTKDRTLGLTKFQVDAIIKAGPDKTQPYVAGDKFERTARLVTDNGKTAKGELNYSVTFHPTVNLRNVRFDPAPTLLSPLSALSPTSPEYSASMVVNSPSTHTADHMPRDEQNAAISDLPEKTASGDVFTDTRNGVDAGRPRQLTHRTNASLASLSTVATHNTAATFSTTAANNDGVVMTKEELLSSGSGVFAFHIISGEHVRKGARLEISQAGAFWPEYSTAAARTVDSNLWDEVGETFIREMDNAQITLKLNTAGKDSKEDVQAELTTSLRHLLEKCLDHQGVLELVNDKHPEQAVITSRINLRAKFIPVPIQLELRETSLNCGMIRVTIIDAINLKAADRNGKSDPYCQIYLNKVKMQHAKTSIQKKTLNPKWNEHFDIEVFSRWNAELTVEVFDWDRVSASDPLGGCRINVLDIEPFSAKLQSLPVLGPGGQQQGTLNVSLIFTPGNLYRTRGATSTLHGNFITGAAATGLAGGAQIVGKGGKVAWTSVNVVGSGATSVGKGLLHGAHRMVPGRRSYDGTVDPSFSTPAKKDIASISGDPSPTHHSGSQNINGTVSMTPLSGVPGFGDLQITIIKLSGAKEDTKEYVSVSRPNQSPDKTHTIKGSTGTFEAFLFKTLPQALTLTVTINAKKTLGKDKEVGSTDIDVWKYIHPGIRDAQDVELLIEERTVQLRLAWTAAATPGTPEPSRNSPAYAFTPSSADAPASSIKTKSRFSLHRNKQ